MKHPERELYELVEGDLTGAGMAAVRAHLKTCPTCQATFERMAALQMRLSTVPRLQPAPSFRWEVQARVRALPQPLRHAGWRLPLLTFVLGLLALLPSLDVLLNLLQGNISLPSMTDWVGWLVWFDQLSANIEATLVVGLCAVAVACVLVVTQTLTTLPPQASR